MSTTIVHPDDTGGDDLEQIARVRLSDKHIADLRASGLTWEVIVRAEFRTEGNSSVIGKLLKRRDAARLGPCLLLPYFDLDGKPVSGYVRAKPDFPPPGKKEGDKPAKYLSPSREPIRPYFLPGGSQAIMDASRPIAITEGEKKTAAIWQCGVAVVGLSGVECWSRRREKDSNGHTTGPRQLLDDLARIPWRGRTVYIIYDSDIIAKREVQRAEANLARALTALGAVVMLVRIPPTEDGTKVGIDDYLFRQAEPNKSLRTLFANSVDFKTVTRRVAAGQYRIQDGQIVRAIDTRDGSVETPLCNFTAQIVEEVVRDDGSGDLTIVYSIEGSRANTALPAVQVKAEQFATMNWPAESWGARSIVYAGYGNRDHLRTAIQMLSDPTRRTIYTHLGWREIGGQWHYLHAGGAIGPMGPTREVCCDPPGPLRKFELPVSLTQEMIRAGVQASLRMIDGRVPDRISFPILAAVYRAVLGHCDFSTHLVGPSGAFKSEFAALAEQHFGPEMDSRHLPGSWSSTGNALEGLAFFAKDALLVVDDYAPSGTSSDVQRMNRDAERFFRAQGNNSGRLRMTSDANLRAERPPRGLTLSTGEDTPRGQSIQARLVILELELGTISTEVLSEFQRDAAAGLYAQSLGGFVAFLAPQYERVLRRLPAERVLMRDLFASGSGHARTPTAVADLALGLHNFLNFAVTIGVITAAERAAIWQRGEAAMRCVCGEQADHIASADPVDLYLRLLRTIVASGRGHIASRTGNRPEQCPESWGWRPRASGLGEHELCDWQPHGHRLGWLDRAEVYLDSDGAFAEVQRLANEQGQSIPLSSRTLHRRLHERKLLARIGKAGSRIRYCVRMVLEGLRRDVLCFSRATLFPSDSEPDAPGDN